MRCKFYDNNIIWMVAGLLMLAVCPGNAQENGPSKRVTVIVPYPAGGYIDTVARLLSDGLRQMTGQQVVVVNKSGATAGFVW